MDFKSSLKIWLIPLNSPLKAITKAEEDFSRGLSSFRRNKYILSRGYIREVISILFSIKPLDVPIINLIGKPPILKDSLGYLSLSYSQNNLIICWSFDNVGVDMESNLRNFDAKNLMDRFYLEQEKKFLINLDGPKMRESVLQYWVFKEACIKLIKGSISKNLNQIQIIDTNFAKNNLDGSYINLFNLRYKDFFIGIASKNKILIEDCIICGY